MPTTDRPLTPRPIRLARTLGEPAPSPKRRGHRDAFDGVDDTRASWDMAMASFANSAAPSPIAPLASRKPPSTNAPPQPATPAGSVSGREGGDRAWGPALAGSANPSPSKPDPHRADAIHQRHIQIRRLSAESARSARTQDDPHVLSQPNDFEASSPLRERSQMSERNGSSNGGDGDDDDDESAAELRERLRRAEASIRSMRVELENAAERARMDALTRERAEATATDLERTLAKFATQNEEMLAAVKRQTTRAMDAEQKAKIAARRVGETRLSDARRLEVAMKAGYLARYWRAAFALGVAPGGGGGCMAREAATWAARAPAGGSDALVGLIERVAREGGAHSEHQSVTPVAKEFFARREYGGADGGADGVADGGADGSGSARAWRPSTLADAVDVEIGLRVMRDARVEEAVLVALADRRRALAERTCGDAGSSSVSGASGPVGRSGDWITLSEAEESEVAYRRAWLAFLWWRARGARVEPGVCEGRCEEWFRRVAGTTPTFDAAREALEVEEGLRELRELGVEAQLWRRSGPSGVGRRLSRGPGPVPGG